MVPATSPYGVPFVFRGPHHCHCLFAPGLLGHPTAPVSILYPCRAHSSQKHLAPLGIIKERAVLLLDPCLYLPAPERLTPPHVLEGQHRQHRQYLNHHADIIPKGPGYVLPTPRDAPPCPHTAQQPPQPA